MAPRALASVLFAATFVWMAWNGVREYRGVVTIVGRTTAVQYVRADTPRAFRVAMNFEWVESGLPTLAGVFLLWLMRRQDRLDPFSSNFRGASAVDDLGKYLDAEIAKKNVPRKRPGSGRRRTTRRNSQRGDRLFVASLCERRILD